MGRDVRSGKAKRQNVSLLSRAVSGHHIQHHSASQDTLLHGQLDCPVCGYIFFDRAHILLAERQRRKDRSLREHSPLAYRVLFAPVRTHTTDITCGASDREVSPVYYDSGYFVNLGDCHRIECALSLALDPLHAQLGQAALFAHSAEALAHASAAV